MSGGIGVPGEDSTRYNRIITGTAAQDWDNPRYQQEGVMDPYDGKFDTDRYLKMFNTYEDPTAAISKLPTYGVIGATPNPTYSDVANPAAKYQYKVPYLNLDKIYKEQGTQGWELAYNFINGGYKDLLTAYNNERSAGMVAQMLDGWTPFPDETKVPENNYAYIPGQFARIVPYKDMTRVEGGWSYADEMGQYKWDSPTGYFGDLVTGRYTDQYGRPQTQQVYSYSHMNKDEEGNPNLTPEVLAKAYQDFSAQSGPGVDGQLPSRNKSTGAVVTTGNAAPRKAAKPSTLLTLDENTKATLLGNS